MAVVRLGAKEDQIETLCGFKSLQVLGLRLPTYLSLVAVAPASSTKQMCKARHKPMH